MNPRVVLITRLALVVQSICLDPDAFAMSLIAVLMVQRVWAPPPKYFGIHIETMENGVRLPFNSEFLNFFREIELSPAQLVPNAMGLMVALFVLLKTLGESFTAANVFAVFSFAKSGDTPGMFYVNQRTDRTRRSDNRDKTEKKKTYQSDDESDADQSEKKEYQPRITSTTCIFFLKDTLKVKGC